MKEERIISPAHLALWAFGHAPIGDLTADKVIDALNVSFRRLDETANFVLNRTTVSLFSYYDTFLDEAVFGEHSRAAVSALGAFLERWSTPASADLLFAGDFSLLPPDLFSLGVKPRPYDPKKHARAVIWFIGYSGKREIVNAARKLAASGEEAITDAAFEKNLTTAGMPDPDLVILTGGHFILPDFLPYQISYSELYLPEVTWRDFTTQDIKEALRIYGKRDRRYGMV